MKYLSLVLAVAVLGGCTGPSASSRSTDQAAFDEQADRTGWDRQALGELISQAAEAGTDTLVVVHGGEIIVEEYFGNDPDYQRDIASAQKGIIALLIGIAEDEGLLGLDDPVTAHLGAGWAHGALSEADITIRHLLTMSSGLDSDFETVAAPGTVWEYNNNVYHKLRLVLEAVAGDDIQAVSDEWLFDPIGAAGSWSVRGLVGLGVRDSHGDRLLGLSMGPSDLAAVGRLVLAEGAWGDTQIVPADYVAEALSPSQDLNPAYGYLWWLNGSDRHLLPLDETGDGPLVPSAPTDAAGALGAADQKLWVSSSLDLIIVRQGGSALGWRASLSAFDEVLWDAVMRAYPAP